MSTLSSHRNRTYLYFTLLVIFIFGMISVWSSQAFSEVDLDTRLRQIETKLQQLENLQTSAQTNQEEIAEKIKTLKIWAHRG